MERPLTDFELIFAVWLRRRAVALGKPESRDYQRDCRQCGKPLVPRVVGRNWLWLCVDVPSCGYEEIEYMVELTDRYPVVGRARRRAPVRIEGRDHDL